MSNKKVFIVHAIDTEGPLTESSNETIKRFNEIIKPKIKIKNKAQLLKALEGKKFSNTIQKKIKKNFHPHLLKYNNSWTDIKKMLKYLGESNLRNELLDHSNNKYRITWHCVDHVNYKTNLRKRDLGYNKIFDFYKNYIEENNLEDDIQFHFHPMSVYKECHRDGYLLMRNDNLYQILCRRILDRRWFPSSFRAGFHSERQDLHMFLENYIPFDLSNINKKNNYKNINLEPQLNSAGYDWRRATDKWEVYNPDFYDYQIKGKCKRYIGRVLTIMDRTVAIDQDEVDAAFSRANSNEKTMLAVTNHDFRNINYEIKYFLNMIKKSALKFPKVKFYYNTTTEAFQNCLNLNNKKNKLKLKIYKIDKNHYKIKAVNGSVFGPQPFLALKLKNGKYVHDNLNFDIKLKNIWYYTLSSQHNIPPEDLKSIGVGACDNFGNSSVDVISIN